MYFFSKSFRLFGYSKVLLILKCTYLFQIRKNNEKIKPFYVFLVHHNLWFVFVFFYSLCSRYNHFKSDLVQFWYIYSFWHFFLTHFKLIRYFQGFRSTIIIPMNFHSQHAVFFFIRWSSFVPVTITTTTMAMTMTKNRQKGIRKINFMYGKLIWIFRYFIFRGAARDYVCVRDRIDLTCTSNKMYDGRNSKYILFFFQWFFFVVS